MADKFSKKARSRIMSHIKGKNTSIETSFRKLLWKNWMGRYRIHYNLPGKPDIVYVSKKIVVFLDGDFWHGYDVGIKRSPRVPSKTAAPVFRAEDRVIFPRIGATLNSELKNWRIWENDE